VDNEEGVWLVGRGRKGNPFVEVMLDAFPEAVALEAEKGGFSSRRSLLVTLLVFVDELEVGLHGNICPSISL
jgi:hypothetical protein